MYKTEYSRRCHKGFRDLISLYRNISKKLKNLERDGRTRKKKRKGKEETGRGGCGERIQRQEILKRRLVRLLRTVNMVDRSLSLWTTIRDGSFVSVHTILVVVHISKQRAPVLSIVIISQRGIKRIDGVFVFGNGLLDEHVDDVILDSIHDDREQQHDENYLDSRVALGPPQRPVPDFHDEWKQVDDDNDTGFHPQQSDKVDHGLLEPPKSIGRIAIVSGFYGFWRICERRV